MDWDWESFYRNADYDRCIYLGGEAMVDYLERFLERFGPFDDAVSVGCGPALVLFELAERHPDVTFYGLDTSATLVADNRERTADADLENLEFAVDSLPALETDRQFDLVYCAAVLFFVEDAAAAVADLYDHVREGGYLIVNYPNRYSAARWDDEFDGRKREAFSLVLAERNLLSYDRIREITGAEPRNYWRAVDADEDDAAGRDTPMVYVRK